MSRHVARYAVAVVRATRPDGDEADTFVKQYVEWGAGPRAGQHLVLMAKALAALDGQPTVNAQHIRQAAPLILRHRVLPRFSAAGDGVEAPRIVEHVLHRVREPDY